MTEITYKLNQDKTFSIIFEGDSYETYLTRERGVSNLCKSIKTFINKFSNDEICKVEMKLSDEEISLGIIVDLWKCDEDEPFGVAHYMFDDYNY